MAQKKITATFTVQTSYKGDKGDKGDKGEDGADGADGKNAVRVDLDNEIDEMLFYNGKPWNEVLSTASLYDGPSKVTLARNKWSVTYAVYDSSDATITSGNVPYASSGISIAAIYYTFINSVMTVHVNDIPTANSKEPALLEVTFTATYGDGTYSAVLRVRPSLDGRRYNIVSQPAQLTYNKTTGAKNATKVLVKVMKSEIKQTPAVGQGGFMHALDTGQVLKYRADDTNTWTDLTWSTSKEGAEFTPDFTKTGYYVWLGTNDVMDDQEHIPILGVADGDGAPSATVNPGSIVVKCDSRTGKVTASVSKTLNFSMKVGSASATISGITASSLPTGVTVTGNSASSRQITVGTTATATGLAAGIAFTVTGTYGGKTFSATATLTVVASEKGEAGHTGRWYYFAGAYSGTPSDYQIDETQAPYVKTSNGEFWMLDNQGIEPGTLPYTATENPTDSTQSEWTKMTGTKFNYFIANAVFADSAYLGSFVINKDWLISQHGVIYDAASTPGTHVIDDDSSWNTGGPPGVISKANAYTYFDPDYPNGNKPGYINFVPNYAVDGLTGHAYLNDLYAKNAKLTGELLIQYGNNDGLKLDSNGNVLRWNGSAWINLFARRYTKYVSGSSYTCDNVDDLLLAGSDGMTIYLPSSPGSGRQISIRNVGTGRGCTLKSKYEFVTGDGPDTGYTSPYYWVSLYNDDRAELVFYGGKWYWNAMAT